MSTRNKIIHHLMSNSDVTQAQLFHMFGKSVYVIIRRLVNIGVVEKLHFKQGLRGAPTRIVKLKANSLDCLKKETIQNKILNAIGDDHLFIGEISNRVGIASNNISGMLLEMTKRGKLHRYRTGGISCGNAQSSDYYKYRIVNTNELRQA